MPNPKPWTVVAIVQDDAGRLETTAIRIMAKNAASAVSRRAQEIHNAHRGIPQPRVVGISANPAPADNDADIIGMGPDAWHTPPSSQSQR